MDNSPASAPPPAESGVSGTQQKGEVIELSADTAPPLEGVLLSTIKNIARKNPKNLGGDSTSLFVNGIIHHLTDEIENLKKQIKEKDELLKTTRDNLISSKIDLTAITEKLKAADQHSRKNQWTGIIGTALLGVAIDLYKSGLNISYLVGLFGAIIVALPLLTSYRNS